MQSATLNLASKLVQTWTARRTSGSTCSPVGYPPCHDACTHLSYLAPPGLADPYCDKDKREHSQWFYFRVSNCADETLNVRRRGLPPERICASLGYSPAVAVAPH